MRKFMLYTGLTILTIGLLATMGIAGIAPAALAINLATR
jgi:hypothetical protein